VPQRRRSGRDLHGGAGGGGGPTPCWVFSRWGGCGTSTSTSGGVGECGSRKGRKGRWGAVSGFRCPFWDGEVREGGDRSGGAEERGEGKNGWTR
jgi:hypothetical protein